MAKSKGSVEENASGGVQKVVKNDAWRKRAHDRLNRIRKLKNEIGVSSLELAHVVHGFVVEDNHTEFGFGSWREWSESEGLDPSKVSRWVTVWDRLKAAGISSPDKIQLRVDPAVLYVAQREIKPDTVKKIIADANELPTRQFTESYRSARPEAPNERDPRQPPSNRSKSQTVIEAVTAGTAEDIASFVDKFSAEVGAGVHNISVMVKMATRMDSKEVGEAFAGIIHDAKKSTLINFAIAFVEKVAPSTLRNFCAALVAAVRDDDERGNLVAHIVDSISLSDAQAVRLSENLDGAVSRYSQEARKAG